jgi:hypothetical protein
VKAHVLLDHDDYLPSYVLLTEAKRSDVKLAGSFACAVLLLRARAKPVHVEFGLSTYVYFPVDDHRG